MGHDKIRTGRPSESSIKHRNTVVGSLKSVSIDCSRLQAQTDIAIDHILTQCAVWRESLFYRSADFQTSPRAVFGSGKAVLELAILQVWCTRVGSYHHVDNRVRL